MRILDWRDFVASFVLEELPQLRQAAFIRRTIGKFEHQSIVGFIRLTLREKRKKISICLSCYSHMCVKLNIKKLV